MLFTCFSMLISQSHNIPRFSAYQDIGITTLPTENDDNETLRTLPCLQGRFMKRNIVLSSFNLSSLANIHARTSPMKLVNFAILTPGLNVRYRMLPIIRIAVHVNIVLCSEVSKWCCISCEPNRPQHTSLWDAPFTVLGVRSSI